MSGRDPVVLWPTPELSGGGEGPLSGYRILVKDNLAVRGLPTTAGSRVLTEAEPATSHAVALSRLLRAGAGVVGRANMTELAYSGLGQNPHYGTPPNPVFPGAVPGGSSSGSASGVALGLADAALGTDTGGSVRIPAAFQNLVGFKPTNGLLPTGGVLPLSPTLDVVGPIAKSLGDAWRVFAAVAGRPGAPLPPPAGELRLLALAGPLRRREAPEVTEAFEDAVARIARRGHRVERGCPGTIGEVLNLYRRHGPLAAHEAFRLWRGLVESRGDEMDPRVARRVMEAARYRDEDYQAVLAAHQRLPLEFWAGVRDYHAVLLPTVAILPPRLDELADDEAYFRANAAALRYTMLFNFLKGPALSLPIAPGVGLMLAGKPKGDRELFAVALAVERALSPGP